MSSTTVKTREDRGAPREDKGLSSRNPSPETLVYQANRSTAATVYGESPVAAAAAVGWSMGVATDVATSKKYPAEFTVLTKTVARTVSSGGSNRYE